MTQHRVDSRSRSGITLTEILIAIMIMGVGLISLATLFPLGLMRLREAQRANRSALLTATAESDLRTRDLLGWDRFRQTPYYNLPGNSPQAALYGTTFIDPWVQDSYPDPSKPWPIDIFTDPVTNITYLSARGVYRGYGIDGDPPLLGFRHFPLVGPGLPVAYDPLWRRETGITPNSNFLNDGRFACGFDQSGAWLDGRPEDPGDTKDPSAFGLQRVTNFPIGILAQDLLIDRTFVSPDDIIYQKAGEANIAGVGSPLLPDLSLSNGFPTQEFMFSWMFTGQRTDAFNASVYDGDIVVFHNRPLSLDTSTGLASGERVVEAIFGYSTSVASNGPNTGYSQGDPRVVLLRWPNGRPDPEVRVGSWIADVTYERDWERDLYRFRRPAIPGQQILYPGQRCHWYRVLAVNPATAGLNGTVRQMTVVLDSPVRARTLMNPNNGDAYHLNAALVSPYVVNVFPVTVTTTR